MKTYTHIIIASLFVLGAALNNIVTAQNYSQLWTVELSATVQSSPASITLNWEQNKNSTPDTYIIWRKIKGTQGWGNSIGSTSSSVLTLTDSTVSVGVSYEYHVQFRLGGTIYAWGYINSGIELELTPNKGDLLLLVDSTFIVSLSTGISQLEKDLYNDGWNVTTVGVNPNDSVPDVKALISANYTSLPDLKTVYLFGHIPVPYSGNLNPDGHPDHEGAWPADVYYADMDGVWTDSTVNNTVASQTRNQNVPGDGKFDQSKVPSSLELQVCRVDLSSLPNFTETEEQLLSQYLTKAHNFKIAQYVPLDRGLIDHGNFYSFQDGFAQNGYRNFNAFFGPSNVDSMDYYTTLLTDDYLWSYGCGAGSYTSAQGLNNGSRMYTSDLAAGSIQTTFTMLFGSYFGDWDSNNNLLRASLGSGKTLASSWAGRPNFHYHNMAMGENLGYTTLLSQDKNSDYLSLVYSGGFVTGEGVHVAQMGDPSLRMYYLQAPSGLMAAVNLNDIDLEWTASADTSIAGYNMYRKLLPGGLWSKVSTAIVVDTSFTDGTLSASGTYEYMVKAVKLKVNASGSFYNESLGNTDSTVFIYCAAGIASFSYSTSDLIVSFSDSSLNADDWNWDFGDSDTDTTQSPSHIYNSPGTYAVCLVITNACTIDTFCTTITVCSPLSASFTSLAAELTVSFSDSSTNATNWNWDFGDSSTDTVQNPVHIYNSSGTYTVCLVVNNSCEADTICMSITICELAIADFGFGTTDLTAGFTDQSGNVTSWYWDFGDGANDTVQNPSHTYVNSGTYYVCLSALNVCSADTICDSVMVTAQDTTGIVSLFFERQLEVFPNPTTGNITVRASSVIELFTIRDMTGRLVLKQILNTKEFKLRLHQFNKGLYIAYIRFEDGSTEIRRIVLN